MKNIYVITEQGRVWNEEGMTWIEEVFKPTCGEDDETNVCMGVMYNSPVTMVNELTKHPDSYIIVSHGGIMGHGGVDAWYLEDFPDLVDILSEEIDGYKTTWEILMDVIKSDVVIDEHPQPTC